MFTETQEIARRVAQRASEELGEPLWLRDYPVEIAGEISRVVIGASRGGLHCAVAIVGDLSSTQTATVERMRVRGPTLRGHSLGNARREHELAAAIAAEIRGWPVPRWLGLLDAGYGLFDALGQQLGVAGSGWRLSPWGEWDEDRSGVSVELHGDHEWRDLISIRPAVDGIAIRIPAAQIGGAERIRTVATFGGLLDELGGVIDDVRAAVDGRAAFRARPDSITAVGNRLIDAIRSAHALRGRLGLEVHDGAGFPHAWPTASITKGGSAYVALAESVDGITVTVDSSSGPYRGFAAMAADLPAILAAVRIAGERLRPDHLIEGRLYQAIAPFVATGQQIEPGMQLRFVGVDSVPRDQLAIYRFTVAGRSLELVDHDDADIAILRRLHEVLAPVAK